MNLFRYSVILTLLCALAISWWFLSAGYATSESTTYRWGDLLSWQAYQSMVAPAAEVATSTKIVFTGDVFLGRDVEDGAQQYGYDYSLALFQQPPFTDADAIVVNFESPIPADHRPTPHLGMRFSVATSAVPALRSAGITHAGLANNHTADYGMTGLTHTRSQLTAGDVQPFGDPVAVSTSSVAMLDTVQGPVAIVAIQAVTTTPDMATVRTLLDSLPENLAGVVAYVHWGNEYQENASVTQQALAADLAAAGVDIVIGHHPHVVQNISQIDTVPVIYSLGNTVFDQYFSTAVQTGLMATLEFTATERLIHLYPISSLGSRARPYLMPAREQARFLDDLAQQSDSALTTGIRAGTWNW